MTSNSEAPDSSGWSANKYNKTASFVYSAAYTAPILQLLDAKPGERIIDFGCGSGEVSLDIERIVCANGNESGCLVAFDASESMIEKCKANGVQNAFVSDAQNLVMPQPLSNIKFDAVFSNATLHWCKRHPEGVLDSAKRVLKKGGRFVIEMGGFMNCIAIRSTLYLVLRQRGHDPTVLDPWYFPSVAEYTKLLEAASFKPIHVSLNPRLTPLSDGGLRGWMHLFVRNSFLQNFSDKEADEIINEVVNICEIDCKDNAFEGEGDGAWAMMYMRLRVHAVLEG